LEALLAKRLKTPREALEKNRLAMLGWLVKKGWLEVRVGVMRRGEGIVHAKFGIVTDAHDDAVVFAGSGNETAQGLRGNYERLEISTSWNDAERFSEYRDEFDSLWKDRHPDVHTVSLPEAIRLKLVRFAPREAPGREPSNALSRQRAAMLWHYIVEAPYAANGELVCDATAMVELWPHQRRVVSDVARAWPDGRLLCDEVGMGKTIEAMLALRRLMAGRGVARALILVPAGLLVQWQAELREKGGMLFPRLDGVNTLVWPDGREMRIDGVAQALEQDYLLMSRETARTESNQPAVLAARPWDLVILDEAHAARRARQVEGEYNAATLLLGLLRKLQLERKARALMFLSATPMQTHPWEPWDLLAVLGEGGAWLADFAAIRDYYRAVKAVAEGRCTLDTARVAAQLACDDPLFPGLDGATRDPAAFATRLATARSETRPEFANLLRRGSPLSRRMHRNTRNTLRSYFAAGLLDRPPATRRVKDELFDFESPAERQVYESVAVYIEKRFRELEEERPGKGFVMTIYRRRAASSWASLEKSLRRRKEGLEKVMARHALYEFAEEDVLGFDPSELEGFDVSSNVTLALPTNPAVAARERGDVDRLLGDIEALSGRDSKLDRFYTVLRNVANDGRAVLVFTEYADTMDYLRNRLVGFYSDRLGCYSGRGGEVWDGSAWKHVTKDEITGRLHAGALRILLCTDAASEGLNLQSAGAVINYDLPWNPSRVEQRIGRIDRIGQQLSEVRVVNLFLANSVDEQVYRVLRERCGVFEHFVGHMQPVLARAREMLLGRTNDPPTDLLITIAEIESEPLASETYVESEVEVAGPVELPLRRDDLVRALQFFDGSFGIKAREVGDGIYQVSGVAARFATRNEALEHKDVRELAQACQRPGEHLPLVVGAAQRGAFRRAVIRWLGSAESIEVNGFNQLKALVDGWDGTYPDAGKFVAADADARAQAQRDVDTMSADAERRESAALSRQTGAARLRLLRELGRYLVCFEEGAADLNGILYREMGRDTSTAGRLAQVFARLGSDYPDWPQWLLRELDAFHTNLAPNQRQGRLIGKELDAALNDPRWAANPSSVAFSRMPSEDRTLITGK
jgi:superfamily II DNA or RNA helicase